MMTEDYVSFEIAKLLKEKGFNEMCQYCYADDGYRFSSRDTINTSVIVKDTFATAPTLQMAMKWLREEKVLCIEPYRTACGYLCDVAKVPTGSEIYRQEYEGDDEDSGQFTTYEKACEAAIKYCLENLI